MQGARRRAFRVYRKAGGNHALIKPLAAGVWHWRHACLRFGNKAGVSWQTDIAGNLALALAASRARAGKRRAGARHGVTARARARTGVKSGGRQDAVVLPYNQFVINGVALTCYVMLRYWR